MVQEGFAAELGCSCLVWERDVQCFSFKQTRDPTCVTRAAGYLIFVELLSGFLFRWGGHIETQNTKLSTSDLVGLCASGWRIRRSLVVVLDYGVV